MGHHLRRAVEFPTRSAGRPGGRPPVPIASSMSPEAFDRELSSGASPSSAAWVSRSRGIAGPVHQIAGSDRGRLGKRRMLLPGVDLEERLGNDPSHHGHDQGRSRNFQQQISAGRTFHVSERINVTRGRKQPTTNTKTTAARPRMTSGETTFNSACKRYSSRRSLASPNCRSARPGCRPAGRPRWRRWRCGRSTYVLPDFRSNRVRPPRRPTHAAAVRRSSSRDSYRRS